MEYSNDPELNPKYLGSISTDFVKVADALKESAYQIIARKYSSYPIFVISKAEVKWANYLYGIAANGLAWNYYVSFLEEFVERGLIENDEDFKEVYKDSDEFCCLFVLDKDFVNFLFMPYPEEDNSLEADM